MFSTCVCCCAKQLQGGKGMQYGIVWKHGGSSLAIWGRPNCRLTFGSSVNSRAILGRHTSSWDLVARSNGSCLLGCCNSTLLLLLEHDSEAGCRPRHTL
jgi:hypothetical protein